MLTGKTAFHSGQQDWGHYTCFLLSFQLLSVAHGLLWQLGKGELLTGKERSRCSGGLVLSWAGSLGLEGGPEGQSHTSPWPPSPQGH